MVITIDHTKVEVLDGETLLEVARRIGHTIPSLCYAKGAKHKSSCMVCAVKNCVTGQVIPSCTTIPVDGMHIETDSDYVKLVRTLSFELLLSDHRADCEAPCTLVCPQGLDVERMLGFYDAGMQKEAYQTLAESFSLPEIACDNCKAPCEKACRRGTVDEPVSIRRIVREVSKMADAVSASIKMDFPKPDKKAFQSRLGRFTENERTFLKANIHTASSCLHCACSGRGNCKLRHYATLQGIKRSRYEAGSTLPAMLKVNIAGNLWFEQAKCIRCGLCVYNSENGFTFKDRGFGMQVVLPEENRINIREELAALCPTGALYLI